MAGEARSDELKAKRGDSKRGDKDTSKDMHGQENLVRESEQTIPTSRTDRINMANETRSSAGLGWMTNAPEKSIFSYEPVEKTVKKDVELDDPDKPIISDRELNPYLKNSKRINEEGVELENSMSDRPTHRSSSEKGNRDSQNPSFSGVGDGGASWRLKAIKRAKEKAEREGKSFDEVYGDRWGSTANVASGQAHDKKSSRKSSFGRSVDKGMRMPKTDSISWRRFEKTQNEKHGSSDRQGEDKSKPFDMDNNPHPSHENKHEEYHDVFDGYKGRDKNAVVHSENKDGSKDKYEPSENSAEKENVRGDSATQKVEEEMSLNQISAKILKLKLMGKLEEATKLHEKLEEMKKGEKKTETRKIEVVSEEKGKETIILPSINSKGTFHYEKRKDDMRHSNEKPFDRYDYDHSQKAKSKNLKRMRYFEDDDNLNLKDLVLKQKLSGIDDDYDNNYAENIMKKKHFKENKNMDDEYDFDAGVDMYESMDKKKKKRDPEIREKKKQISDYKRSKNIYEKCHYCFESELRNKNLTISIANHTYLMLSPFSSLISDYCYIVSFQHEGSMRNAEDEVWDEVRNFKKCLLQMQSKKGKNVLFMETALGISKHQKRHRIVEAIPLFPDQFQQAPLYFKKAIDEAEEEWSQHNSKRLIDTRKKGLRLSIPDNFPYFHVEFGLDGGYCHVIDNEMEFKADFGRHIIFGMLEIDSGDTSQRRLSKNSDWRSHQALSAKFLKDWEPHDWTKMLE